MAAIELRTDNPVVVQNGQKPRLLDPQILHWPDLKSLLPTPDFPAYYAQGDHLPSGLSEAMGRFVGDNGISVLVYGAFLLQNPNARRKTKQLDSILIVRDLEKFHHDQLKAGSLRYGVKPNDAEYHTQLNRKGPLYYHGHLELPNETLPIKIGVESVEGFNLDARGGRKDSEQSEEGRGRLWLAGRLHKANIHDLLRSDGTPEQIIIDKALNQARIDGAFLTLSSMPSNVFALREFAGQYVNLSYVADFRADSIDKAESILNGSENDHNQMLNQIFAKFAEVGLIAEREGSYKYQRLAMLDPNELNQWITECRRHAFYYNYRVMWLKVHGVGPGIAYAARKVGKFFSSAPRVLRKDS